MIRTIHKFVRLHLFRAVIVKKPVKPEEVFRYANGCDSTRRKYKKFDVFRSSHVVVYELDLKRKLASFMSSEKSASERMCAAVADKVRPPERVRGMTKLDKAMFDDLIPVPALMVQANRLPKVLKCLKKYQLKLRKISPVVELDKNDPDFQSCKLVLLDPCIVQSWKSISQDDQATLSKEDVRVQNLKTYDLKVTYDAWNFSDILKAVLPEDCEGVSGFEEVGHIAHFNLRNELLPYKVIIGEVLVDKLKNVKTVVNKLSTIDNTFRTFNMEVLSGEENFVTQSKENGCTFELDYSKVYWNTRLGTEHDRIVQTVKSGDVVFDVFAGIGPFSIPAAKKQAIVFANDLNPHSYEALVKNAKINKCSNSIKCFNLDGREFINTKMKEELKKIYSTNIGSDKDETSEASDCYSNVSGVSVIMNLPAMAYTFLDAFRGLLAGSNLVSTVSLPLVHCYSFTSRQDAETNWDGDMEKEVRQRVMAVMEGVLSEDQITLRHVRNVSPQNDMMCITFQLTAEILTGEPATCSREQEQPASCSYGEPESKKARMDS